MIRMPLSSTRDQRSSLTTAPVLDIKQSSSLIRVKSGETIIIGGLIQDKSAQTSRRVPVLGNIPVVGLPFRGEFRADRKTELVIFMTPTVIEDLPPGLVTPPSNANAWPQPGAVAEASPQTVMPESDKNPLPTRNTRKGFLGSRNNHGSRNR
jgi:type II secretory pathway component GspD/PulD (secretin)